MLTEIQKLQNYLKLVQAIPTEQVSLFTRNEWQQNFQMSDYGSGHYEKVTHTICSLDLIVDINRKLGQDAKPEGLSWFMGESNEMPTGGPFKLSTFIKLIENKIELLRKEILFSGEFRIDFFHNSYMVIDPWYRTCASAAEFHALRTQVGEEVRRQKLGYTGGSNNIIADDWWAAFAKKDSDEIYTESLLLFKQRVKL
jgi:hypothetical protein